MRLLQRCRLIVVLVINRFLRFASAIFPVLCITRSTRAQLSSMHETYVPVFPCIPRLVILVAEPSALIIMISIPPSAEGGEISPLFFIDSSGFQPLRFYPRLAVAM